MLPKDSVRVEYVRSASQDQINSLLYEADEGILVALLENPQFQEKHAALLAARVDVSSAVLRALAETGKGKWMGCENVRLRLAQHPQSPKRIAMAAVRQLFLFDLVRLNLLPSAPPDIRRFAEETILGRLPHLPIGEKLSLARPGARGCRDPRRRTSASPKTGAGERPAHRKPGPEDPGKGWLA